MFNLVIKGGTIATDYAVFKGSIAVKDGVIAQILRENEAVPEAEKVIDAEGKIVMPGCIDSHVHIQEPGNTERNDFEHGTQAAAAGGITTILEHPLSVPPVKDKETFMLKYDAAANKCYVDYGFWGALTPNNMDKIPELMDAGVFAIKGFIPYCKPEYPNVSDSVLFEAFRRFSGTDLIIGLHAENAEMAEAGAERMKQQGRTDGLAHMEAREEIVELEAISRVLLFAKETGARVHIVHMTIASGAELIKKARAEGVRVTVETCPQFLTVNCSALLERGPFIRCTPPLRRQENVDKLWDYIFDGTIDFIASDDSFYTYEEKAAGKDNIWLADNGMPAIGTMLPFMIDACLNKKKVPLTRFVQLMSTNTAKIFGLYPRKGSILPGMDADITIIDQNREWVINGADPGMYYMCKWSPYDGIKVKGGIEATIVRGEVVFQDGVVVGKKGYGKFLTPSEHTYYIK